jgi:hypothetical protein
MDETAQEGYTRYGDWYGPALRGLVCHVRVFLPALCGDPDGCHADRVRCNPWIDALKDKDLYAGATG